MLSEQHQCHVDGSSRYRKWPSPTGGAAAHVSGAAGGLCSGHCNFVQRVVPLQCFAMAGRERQRQRQPWKTTRAGKHFQGSKSSRFCGKLQPQGPSSPARMAVQVDGRCLFQHRFAVRRCLHFADCNVPCARMDLFTLQVGSMRRKVDGDRV